MRVKIGNRIYDSNNTPIMLIFEQDSERKAIAEHLSEMEDKTHLEEMGEDTLRKYCRFPVETYEKLKEGDKETKDKIKKFMDEI